MTYFVARNTAEALDLLATGHATVLAGGTDLFARVQQDLPGQRIVDLSGIAALNGISSSGSGWRIGANVTWAQVLKTPLVPAFDGLKAAARDVGSVQIQSTATIVGNICNASPAADGVPALLTLDADIEVVSQRGTRLIPLHMFITGPSMTCLAPGEFVSAICVPAQDTRLFGTFEKLGSRRYLVISIAMVAVVLGVDASGVIDTARIAVGACGPVALRQPELEAALIGQAPQDIEIKPEDLRGLAPISDMRATAQYRQIAAAELVTRAVRQGARS